MTHDSSFRTPVPAGMGIRLGRAGRTIILCALLPLTANSQVASRHDLVFTGIPQRWDEGIPIGNGMLGALLWQHGTKLRLSLDRADLWDLRPMKGLDRPEINFGWVREHVARGDYRPVQEISDEPYEREAAPTKIPGAALEFDTALLGTVGSVRLHLADGVANVRWKSGATLRLFIHATEPVGWFRFEKSGARIDPVLVPPAYAGADTGKSANSVEGSDLRRLGYPPPQLARSADGLVYEQEGSLGFRYQVSVNLRKTDTTSLEGVWSILSFVDGRPAGETATLITSRARSRGFEQDLKSHRQWWREYWKQSSLLLPDAVLERQWYREMYKFGAASRRGAPPITLQAIWTADNGRLPPWKGDFHHDLNTQLSYWPAYAGNHLEEAAAFTDWLWHTIPAFDAYTKKFFGTTGLNVPGVTTLTGQPMGGWIQYSFSPTIAAWLAHHFYLQWRFSMDREFLRARAYPWLTRVAIHIEELSIKGADGRRRLPLSSSPEINDNSITAWFHETTNYDLALIRWLYGAAAEMAGELGLAIEADRWNAARGEWPDLARAADDARLLVAPGVPLMMSHRHFSHLMAIHPLGEVDWDRGELDRQTITASLAELKRLGPSLWVGYSYSWLGSMAARGRNGDAAAEALRIFADCFCLPNSFHANGDQSGTGKSSFTYRPFTLEGNFAFAAGINEMLLQSHGGAIRIFPAIPTGWRDVSFRSLRAQGAMLVSAVRAGGETRRVTIISKNGGLLRLVNPFGDRRFIVRGDGRAIVRRDGMFLLASMDPGETIRFTRR